MTFVSVPAVQPLCSLDFGRRDLHAPVSMRNRRPVWVSSKKKALVDMVATAEGGGPIACILTIHMDVDISWRWGQNVRGSSMILRWSSIS